MTRGHSTHQERAHKYLVSQGWEFDRQSGKTSNVYKHKDGRRVIVDATPTNPSNAMNHIRQAITIREEGEVHTQVSKTAPLVAMADPFLLKIPTNRTGVNARRSAYVAWMKRAMEKYGPLESELLYDASGEMGITKNVCKAVRTELGIVGYKLPGDSTVYASFEANLPEDASRLGRRPNPSSLGVQAEAQEPAEHPIGENNGAGPEPREEPAQALEPSGIPGLSKLPPDWVGPSATAPVQQWAPNAALLDGDGDVGAAAQLLLQSLGLKVMDPRVTELVKRAQHHKLRADCELTLMNTALGEALRLVVE